MHVFPREVQIVFQLKVLVTKCLNVLPVPCGPLPALMLNNASGFSGMKSKREISIIGLLNSSMVERLYASVSALIVVGE
jgi:hypothetical protein